MVIMAMFGSVRYVCSLTLGGLLPVHSEKSGLGRYIDIALWENTASDQAGVTAASLTAHHSSHPR